MAESETFIPRLDGERDKSLDVADPARDVDQQMTSLDALKSQNISLVPTTVNVKGKEVDITILSQVLLPPDVLEQELQWKAEQTLPDDEEFEFLRG